MHNSMCFKTWYDLTIHLPEQYFYWCCKTLLDEEQINPTKFDAETLSLDYILNNPVIQKRKQELASGIRSRECKECWDNENATGSSFRTAYYGNDFSNLTDDYLKVLPEKDLTRKIEIVLTNKCNSACVYCWEGLSTRWQKETGNKFKDTDDLVFDKVIEVLKEYWNTELKNKKYLSFSLLGGEPFFSNHMFDFIEKFINTLDISDNQTIEIETTTSLNFNHKMFDRFFNLIKQNEKVKYTIIVSGETIGDKLEYIRWGTNWNTWNKNFDIICETAKNYPMLNVGIGSAHNSLSLPYLKEFLQYIENKKLKIPLTMVSNWVEFPYPLSIGMIEKNREKDIDEALIFFDSMKTKMIRKEHYRNAITNMKNIIGKEISGEDYVRSTEFFTNLETRRNISFSDVFPHFSELVKTDK